MFLAQIQVKLLLSQCTLNRSNYATCFSANTSGNTLAYAILLLMWPKDHNTGPQST